VRFEVRVLWLALTMASVAGCRTAAPLIGAEEVPARATMAGNVAGPHGGAPLAGRLVSAVEQTSGALYSTKTQDSGGFVLLVPPGRYRLEVALIPAERVVEDPGVIELAPGEIIDDVDVVVGGVGVVKES
jgi:hypothetical protein